MSIIFIDEERKFNLSVDIKEKKKSGTVLMTEGSIWKKLLIFSVPLILGNLLQQLYSTVDSIIVGNCVGKEALAAVGSTGSIVSLLIAFSQGASVGAGVIISQYMGAKRKDDVKRAVHTAMAIAVIIGLLLTVAGVFMSRLFLVWMQTPDNILDGASLYLQIYCGGLLFNVLYNMCAGIFNAAGNSKRPLLYLGAASVVNIALDLILIQGFGMGVEGAAIATDASQLVSCVMAIIYMVRVNADYKLFIRQIKVHRDMAIRIIKIGLPTGIQNMVISFSNVLVQASVNSFGSDAVAGFGAYLKVDGFNILPVLSISMAVTTFVGQNYGANKPERVKKGMWTALGMGVVYTVITGILLLVFADPIIRLFTNDGAVAACGETAMKYFCPFYFLLAIMNVLAGAVRGTGKSIPPMLILLFAMCIFRIFWIWLVVPLFPTIDGVYLLYPVSWVIGVVLMALYTWKGKWMPKIE